jgi:hypothetical protein
MKTYSVQFLTQKLTVYHVVANSEDEAEELAWELDVEGAPPAYQATLSHDVEYTEIAS